MSKLWLFLLCVFFAGVVVAQEAPRVELFGGYSYLRIDTGDISSSSLNAQCNLVLGAGACPDGTFKVRPDFNGWNSAAQFNFNREFGLKVEGSGHYGTPLAVSSAVLSVANSFGITGFPPKSQTYSFLAGPVISNPQEKYTPFLHVLAGINRLQADRVGTGIFGPALNIPASVRISDDAFALVLGGGVDFKVNRYLWFRAAQFDYLLTTHDPNAMVNSAVGTPVLSGLSTHQNNFRYSAGAVFHFGGTVK